MYMYIRVVQKNRTFEMLTGYPLKICDCIRQAHTPILKIFEKRLEVARRRRKYVFLVVFDRFPIYLLNKKILLAE